MRLFAISFATAAVAMCLVSGVHAAPSGINTDMQVNSMPKTASKRDIGLDRDLLRDIVDALSEILEPGLELDEFELDDLVDEVLENLEIEDIGADGLLTSLLDVVSFALENLLDVISDALDDTLSS